MILTKTDQRVIKFYEECLADEELKQIGEILRKKLTFLIKLNKRLIPKHILDQRKEFRKSIMVRDTYAEILNLLQADIMRKLNKRNLKSNARTILSDAMFVVGCYVCSRMLRLLSEATSSARRPTQPVYGGNVGVKLVRGPKTQAH